jgi:hypothetical protein
MQVAGCNLTCKIPLGSKDRFRFNGNKDESID